MNPNPNWKKNAKGVMFDRYHPPIFKPRGEGVNKRIRSHK